MAADMIESSEKRQDDPKNVKATPPEVVTPHNFDPKRDVALIKGEYALLVHDARRYEFLRDHMRRMPLGEKGTRHFFDQSGALSFQEAVDEAKALVSPQAPKNVVS
jgi:hypothetical protein